MNKITMGVFALSLFTATVTYADNFSSNRSVGDSANKSFYLDKRVKSIFKATLPTPVTKAATNVTEGGYTANWEPVPGAASYLAYSIMTHTAAADGEYIVISDDFNKVKEGSIDKPVELENITMYLDKYTNYCDWYAVMPIISNGMIGFDNQLSIESEKVRGRIYSPNLDLSHDNGHFSVEITLIGVDLNRFELQYTVGDDATPIEIKSEEITGEVQKFIFDFTNGSQVSHLTLLAEGAGLLFLDEIKVVQRLKTGDQLSIKHSIVETKETSCNFLTPDKTKDDSFCFVVSAFGSDKEDRSASSLPQEVIYPAGINDAKENETRVYMDGMLSVELTQAAPVQVYSITGMCISEIQGEEGVNRISLPGNGTYLVKVGGKTFRVVK